ncbi:MAG: cytochrome P450 [Novosphingobium sp.]
MREDGLQVLRLDEALPAGLAPDALLAHSIMEPEVLVRPAPYYRALRETNPVYFDEKAGMWFVSRHEDLLEIARDSETFSVGRAWNQTFAREYFDEYKTILMRDGGGYFPDAIMTDPPTHTRVRGLLQQAFTPSRIRKLEPLIRAIAARLIESLAPRGRMDGVNDFAMPLTLAIMCEQLGIPHEDGPKVLRWTRALAAIRSAQSAEHMREEARHFCDLQNYVIACIRARQEQRTDDMISDLIYARGEDGKETLSFDEIVSLARALMIGGLDSIGTANSTMLYLIASDPEIATKFEESAPDESRLNRFIEEMLRLEPPARGLFRVATRDVALPSGGHIPEGALICLLFASANDDETVFDHPRQFDMDRERLSRHLTFGGGMHICIGMHLARMQIKVAAQELHKRLTNFQLAIPREAARYHPTLAMLSLEDLPLTFTAR